LPVTPVVGAAGISVPAGRLPSNVLSATRQHAAILKAMGANGVIGGPRTAGSASVGGPVNSKTVINASIDGKTLRRRS
jgi:hypothetical protein